MVMQMNANQLTKIPVEKLSETLRFLIAENEIPLSDALKQVIDDVDAACNKLLRDELAPAQHVIPERLGENLPCPFCGGEVDISGWRSSNGNSGPECNECGATACNLSDWNKRIAQHVIPEQPELVDLSQQVEILNRILNWILKELPVPTQKASVMATRLSSVIDIISDLELPAPAQPVSEHKPYAWAIEHKVGLPTVVFNKPNTNNWAFKDAVIKELYEAREQESE